MKRTCVFSHSIKKNQKGKYGGNALSNKGGKSRTEYRELVAYEVPIVEVIMAHHDTVIRADDHVIVFCTSKKLVAKVEKLFQVGWGFF